MKTLLFKPRYSLFCMVVSFVSLLFIVEIAARDYQKKRIEARYNASIAKSPLPEISVAKMKYIDNPYLKDYQFTLDVFTGRVPVWEKVLASYKGKVVNYLEVGVLEGASLLWMLENILTHPESKATVIDIMYRPKYLSNIELSGFKEKVTPIEDFSQLALRKLPFETYDIIYIDGSHHKQDVLEDAVLSWRLLKKGGLLIFDDYRLRIDDIVKMGQPKVALDPFAQCFCEQLEVVHNGFQLILRRREK